MISLLTSAMRGSVSLAALTTLPSSLVPDLVPSITSGAWHGVSLLVIHKYDLNILCLYMFLTTSATVLTTPSLALTRLLVTSTPAFTVLPSCSCRSWAPK